jgi:hypothetical protein
VTLAFAMWGSKILDAVGVDVLSWTFWQDPANLAKYDAGFWGEETSVMDLGIIVGALIASAAAGAFVLHRRVPLRLGVGAVVGGILMGYGARIAFGCNIRRLFRRHRVVQPARLALGRDGDRRHLRGARPATAAQADQPEAHRLGLLTDSRPTARPGAPPGGPSSSIRLRRSRTRFHTCPSRPVRAGCPIERSVTCP